MHFIPPNRVIQKTGFYISFNNNDVAIFGDVTTAIVIGEQMVFYILLGDHRDAYEKCGDNLDRCIEYFLTNSDKISEYSDRPGEPTASEKIALDFKNKRESRKNILDALQKTRNQEIDKKDFVAEMMKFSEKLDKRDQERMNNLILNCGSVDWLDKLEKEVRDVWRWLD